MNINSVSSVNFGVGIPRSLRDDLFYDARKMGAKATSDYFEQVKKIEKWGLDSSEIACIENRTPKGKETFLGLVNNVLAPLRQIKLPSKETILDSFLALTERDILKAEYKLEI